MKERADKPGSVVDSHSSGLHVTVRLKQPTRKRRGPRPRRTAAFLFGLAPGGVYPATPVTRRAVRSYRTISPLPVCTGGIFSVALSVGSRPPGVTWHPALWSPDFPRRNVCAATVWPARVDFSMVGYRECVNGAGAAARSRIPHSEHSRFRFDMAEHCKRNHRTARDYHAK